MTECNERRGASISARRVGRRPADGSQTMRVNNRGERIHRHVYAYISFARKLGRSGYRILPHSIDRSIDGKTGGKRRVNNEASDRKERREVL